MCHTCGKKVQLSAFLKGVLGTAFQRLHHIEITLVISYVILHKRLEHIRHDEVSGYSVSISLALVKRSVSSPIYEGVSKCRIVEASGPKILSHCTKPIASQET